MKRLLDVTISFTVLLGVTPLLLLLAIVVWCQDRHSPFYIAPRVGLGGATFRMVKLRSMVVGADKTGVDSTGASDPRITAVGHFIRHYKLDEIPQLWNVLTGDMSLVGPRPNVARETGLYTREEERLLSVKPGITDFASIVFSDEGEILKGHRDPDIAYHQLIRPGKNRLGLFYIDHRSFWLDVRLCVTTLVAIVSRRRALKAVQDLLRGLGADRDLIELAGRVRPLKPEPPPGTDRIVMTREADVPG